VWVDSNYSTGYVEVLGNPSLDFATVRTGCNLPPIAQVHIDNLLGVTDPPFEGLIFSEPTMPPLDFLLTPPTSTNSSALALADMQAYVATLGPGSFVTGPSVTDRQEISGPWFGGLLFHPDGSFTEYWGVSDMTRYDVTAQWQPAGSVVIPEPSSAVAWCVLAALGIFWRRRR
jgi:hypothetical protein